MFEFEHGLIKKGKLQIRIKDIYLKGDMLRVEVETAFGTHDLGLSSKSQYPDENGIPKWKSEVKDLLIKKYGDNKRGKVNVFFEEKGKIYDLLDLNKKKVVKKNV